MGTRNKIIVMLKREIPAFPIEKRGYIHPLLRPPAKKQEKNKVGKKERKETRFLNKICPFDTSRPSFWMTAALKAIRPTVWPFLVMILGKRMERRKARTYPIKENNDMILEQLA